MRTLTCKHKDNLVQIGVVWPNLVQVGAAWCSLVQIDEA